MTLLFIASIPVATAFGALSQYWVCDMLRKKPSGSASPPDKVAS